MKPAPFLLALLLAQPLLAATARMGLPVMGTVLEVTVVAADEATARRLAADAIAEARRWDDVLTTWRPEGELARLNARAGSGPISVHPELALALTEMRRLHRATSGAFDPAVGSLVAIWRNNDRPPANLLAATRLPTLDEALTVDGSHVTLASGVVLDAGGFGKGWALDRIAERLRAGGAKAAYLDFGGSSQLALGAPPGSPEGWIVLIAGLDAGEVLGAIRLKDAALSTSRALAAGDEAGPIVDPRTRRPVAPPRLATVLTREAATAEAWSKAAIVLGPESFERARRQGVEGLLLDRDGMRVTDGFALRNDEALTTPRIE